MNAKMAMLTLSTLIAAKASATQVETEVKVDSVNAVSKTQTEAKQKKLSQVSEEDDYQKFRFGGYGEMVAAFKDYGINRFYGGNDGNKKDGRNTISIPRFVLALDYKFNPKWI